MIEWIPVTERLPPFYVSVLVCEQDEDADDDPEYQVAGLTPKGWDPQHTELAYLAFVTHWAEINPPK